MAVLLNEAQTHHCGSEDPSLSAYFLPSHQHLDRCSVFQKSTLFSPSWDLSATLSVDLLLLIPQSGTCSPIFSTFPDGSLLQGPAKPSFLRRPSQTVQSPWDFLVRPAPPWPVDLAVSIQHITACWSSSCTHLIPSTEFWVFLIWRLYPIPPSLLPAMFSTHNRHQGILEDLNCIVLKEGTQKRAFEY